jgi:hypothetical protein
MGNGIGRGSNSPEAVTTVLVGEEVGTTCSATIAVLNVIEAIVVSLPDFDSSAREWASFGVCHRSFDPARFSHGVLSNVSAILDERRIFHEEGAEDGGLCGCAT